MHRRTYHLIYPFWIYFFPLVTPILQSDSYQMKCSLVNITATAVTSLYFTHKKRRTRFTKSYPARKRERESGGKKVVPIFPAQSAGSTVAVRRKVITEKFYKVRARARIRARISKNGRRVDRDERESTRAKLVGSPEASQGRILGGSGWERRRGRRKCARSPISRDYWVTGIKIAGTWKTGSGHGTQRCLYTHPVLGHPTPRHRARFQSGGGARGRTRGDDLQSYGAVDQPLSAAFWNV